jgi:hypothetical protein
MLFYSLSFIFSIFIKEISLAHTTSKNVYKEG